jgi:uncharacterized phage protein (TIGR01671 family)
MNNLKFRAWHKPSKKMCEVYNLDLYDGCFTIDINAPEFSTYNFDDDDCILMQSTGQFDVNGVEIFVGDIIECDYIKIGMDNKHPIKKQIEITSVEFDHFSKGGIVNLNVIGNIYEHSHLLDIT